MKLKDYIQEHKNDFTNETMSKNADVSFEKLLKQELHQPKKQKVISIKFISIAASVVIVFSVGFWYLNQEKIDIAQQQLMASLDAESAGERLEGVYAFNDEYKKEDRRIINRLIEIIHKDENANVKIATIDALLQFPSNEKIRTNLIQALEKENKPLVQIKLIKALSILRENRANKPLERIINDEKTYPIVKNNATLAMVEIKK
ncbi:HEAT repeat domain-containing protein [Polaribacter sp. Asnod6-C07]|uniref:HEAT repeat domain-containing protein n=1 Tax=Polaribacter sp. Asnod6-C07 TaxID=3160582 RepID=UPI003867109E